MLRLVRVLTRIILNILYRVKVENRENIPVKGAAILCSNHNSGMDMFLIGMSIKRFIRWMAKEELFRNRLTGALFRWFGAFPVKRGKGDLGSIKTALALLEQGEIIGIFPEGTRVKTKENEKRTETRMKSGVALLASKAGVPILPVAVSGKQKLFSRVTVRFGEAFTLDADPDVKYGSEELADMTRKIMSRVYALMEAK